MHGYGAIYRTLKAPYHMKTLQIKTLPYAHDNYCYLIHHHPSGKTALVDCGDARPVLAQLEEAGWDLHAVLLTHHHYDHTVGTSRIIEAFPSAVVYAPDGESRIDIPSNRVKDGDLIPFGPLDIEVVSVPAHTRHCTNYHIRGHLFVSDTLFSCGCGRLFEGGATDLERAMDRIAGYPPETRIYFGHEYTVDNLRFALTVEPSNRETLAYMEECRKVVDGGGFTTPTTLERELKVNPFLRIDEDEVLRFVDPDGRRARSERLGILRRKKDIF